MQKYVAITIVFLSLVAVPSLCTSGLLTHLCDCAHESDCDKDTGCDHESECAHEEDCPDDPCRAHFVRTERQNESVKAELDLLGTVAFEIPPDTVLAVLYPFLTCTVQNRSAPSIPYAPSDIPLLI